MAHGIKAFLIIAVIAVVTYLLRAAPFLLFSNGKKPPAYVNYLGRVLPYAMIALLIVYCLKDVSITSGSHGLPELIAIAAEAALHLWKHNTMLSISIPTVLYMLLIQYVFV